MTRLLPWAAALTLAGCAMAGAVGTTPACTSDDQCPGGELCFAEGCGDPGKGVVVEVRGDPQSGLYTRDWPIADGALGREQDFALGAPLRITGEFQRERTGNPDPTNRTFYNGPVVLRAAGVSALIPGVSRAYEQRFERPERGRYEMNTGEGTFRLTAWPDDPSVPPAVTGEVSVSTATPAPDVTFAFPAVEGAVTLSGALYSRYDAAQSPQVAVALSGLTLDVQAFDPETREALSQRFPVSSRGIFTLTLSPRARSLRAVHFVVTPRSGTALVPTRRFLIEAPFPNSVSLEYGEPGAPVELAGQVLDSTGAAVAGAQVFAHGTALGGGQFRSQTVLTDQQGRFQLQTLVNAPTESLIVVAIPPTRLDGTPSLAAVTERAVRLDAAGAAPAPIVVTCADRARVAGQVLTPAGTPAVGVGVRAIEQIASEARGSAQPFVLDPVQAVTDADGRYELHLDPAIWRLEFIAPELPTSSRLVTVQPMLDAVGEKVMSFEQSLVRLSEGRTVTGRVTGAVGLKSDTALAASLVTFYRVTSVGGRPSAFALGAAVTDNDGRYRVVLPSR